MGSMFAGATQGEGWAKLAGCVMVLASLAACDTPATSGEKTTSLVDKSTSGPGIIQRGGNGVDGVARDPLGDDFAKLQAAAGDRVLFEYDSAVIGSQYVPVLQGAAAWLKQHPSVVVTIEGHADERGTREYNLALGAKRAEALQNALISLAVTRSQIAGTVSYGKERPAVVGSTEASWVQNRRAVITVQRPS